MRSSILLAFTATASAFTTAEPARLSIGTRTRPITAVLPVPWIVAGGIMAAGMMAPLADDKKVVADDVNAGECEILTFAPSSLHQPMQMRGSDFSEYADMGFEEQAEEDWWVCPQATLEAHCKAVFVDGDYQVACAY